MGNPSLLDLEAELVQRLSVLNNTSLRVMPTPSDVAELKSPKTNRLLIAFAGETFQPPKNQVNRDAPVIQPYEIRFTLILQLRELRSHQGALPLISQIRNLITGWIPDVTGYPVYQSNTEYLNNTDGIWTFAMSFVAPAVYQKRVLAAPSAFPVPQNLVASKTGENSISVTWNHPAFGMPSLYQIQINEDNQQSVSSSTTTYTYSALPLGTYIVRLRAVYAGGRYSEWIQSSPVTIGVTDSDIAAAMPNVPAIERAAIATAINNAARGRAFSATTLLTTLASMGYWYNLTSASSCFSDASGTIPCNNGDSIQVAKSWLTQVSVTQPTATRRPTFNAAGSTFVKANSQFLYSSTDLAYPNNAATILVAVAPANTSTANGNFCKVGDSTSGYGIGVGTVNVDTSGNNLIGLVEIVLWIPSVTPIDTTPSINTLTTNDDSYATLYHNGVLVAAGPGNGFASAGGFSIGGSLGTGATLTTGAHRFFDGKIYSVILKNSGITPAQVMQLSRFLSFYHGFGIF